MADERCETCKYWRRNEPPEERPILKHACIRYPPIVIFKFFSKGRGKAVFPATDAYTLCGEYKPNG